MKDLYQINESIINKGQRDIHLIDGFFASLDSPEVKNNVFDSGVVPTLVVLLGEQEFSWKALKSLTKLLRHDEKKTNAVVQAIPAIPFIINILKHGSYCEKEIAIKALRPYAVANDDTQTQTLTPRNHLINAKVVKTLSSILCSNSVSLHSTAAEMLAIILYNSTPETRLEVEDEAILRLMDMTKSIHKEVRYFALNALKVINYMGIRRIMYEGNFEYLQNILTSMINTTEKLERCRATEIAHMLLVDNNNDDDDGNNCKSSLLSFGIISCLVRIVMDKDCLIKTRCKAMESLVVICEFPNFRENFQGMITKNLFDSIKELSVSELESVRNVSESLRRSLIKYRPPRRNARICPGEQPALVFSR